MNYRNTEVQVRGKKSRSGHSALLPLTRGPKKGSGSRVAWESLRFQAGCACCFQGGKK
jgi:hypothetical protein